MDNYRGQWLDREAADDAAHARHYGDDEPADREPPPSIVGQDERRMQVRAYNHWASLLDNRNFPSIEDLEPGDLPDFGPYSVLLDFTQGMDNPAIRYLGDKLAVECGATGAIGALGDVPSRSLLSRITDHYMQILANQAPIGFEAEFVNQRGATLAYRGILLPFSSDDDTIDFIYGVINWKELADARTTDELLLEVDQALDRPEDAARVPAPLTKWADGPPEAYGHAADDDNVLDLATLADADYDARIAFPEPAFGGYADAPLPGSASLDLAPAADADMGLADWLASARELAAQAQGSEDRTRGALYAAIGRAYDFSLAAAEAPDEFDELVIDAGLTVQDRAPLTPIVKLVFGADYDKTRLAEYGSALAHAQRLGLARGALAAHLASAPGGLKSVVHAERKLRREEAGKPDLRDTPREALAKRLRKLDHTPLTAVSPEGSEFALLVARRLPTGEVVLLGEVADDAQLLEKVAKRLLG